MCRRLLRPAQPFDADFFVDEQLKQPPPLGRKKTCCFGGNAVVLIVADEVDVIEYIVSWRCCSG